MDLTGKRAVGLLRMSTAEQMSLDEQERLYLAFVEQHQMTSIAHWRVTGSTSETHIPRFLQTMRDNGVTAYDTLERMWDNHEFDVLWTIDPKRLGRSHNVFFHMMENTVKTMGGVVAVHGVGIVDRSNYNTLPLLLAFDLSTDIDRLHGARATATMRDKAKQGIAPMKVLWAYEKTYLDGAPVGVRLKEDARPIIAHMTDLLLDGYSYRDMAQQLHALGYETNLSTATRVRRTLIHPMIHGHLAYGGATRHGLWCFDPTVSPPDGVTIAYDVCPCPWDDDTHQAVIQNLSRRMASPFSHASHGTRNPFRGLVYCARCGASMVYDHYQKKSGVYEYLRCGQRCPGASTRLDYLQDWMHRLLQGALDRGFLTAQRQATADQWRDECAALTQEIAVQEGVIKRLYLQRARSGKTAYLTDDLITQQEAHLGHLKDRLHRLQQRKPIDPAQQRHALADLRQLSLDRLWTLPPHEVNRYLRRVMGKARFRLDGKTIIISESYV